MKTGVTNALTEPAGETLGKRGRENPNKNKGQ
jgi:hypothetical protein